jgi:hypothetical protein
MSSDDRCPSNGQICRNAACEYGGCRKMRATPSAAPKAKPASPVHGEIDTPDPDTQLELKRLRDKVTSAIAAQAEMEGVLDEAIQALEHTDAALTLLQQSLGVKSSPRLEELRRMKARLRVVLKHRTLGAPSAETAEPPAPGDGG